MYDQSIICHEDTRRVVRGDSPTVRRRSSKCVSFEVLMTVGPGAMILSAKQRIFHHAPLITSGSSLVL